MKAQEMCQGARSDAAAIWAVKIGEKGCGRVAPVVEEVATPTEAASHWASLGILSRLQPDCIARDAVFLFREEETRFVGLCRCRQRNSRDRLSRNPERYVGQREGRRVGAVLGEKELGWTKEKMKAQPH